MNTKDPRRLLRLEARIPDPQIHGGKRIECTTIETQPGQKVYVFTVDASTKSGEAEEIARSIGALLGPGAKGILLLTRPETELTIYEVLG